MTLQEKIRTEGRRLATRAFRTSLERVTGSKPVIIPEYPLRPRAKWGWGNPVPCELARIFDEAEAASSRTIEATLDLREWCSTIPRSPSANPAEPCWDNEFWGGLDAAVGVAQLRARDPALLIEIGSGHSTKFARRATADFGLRTRIVSVDPEPRAEINGLCDEVVRMPAEEAPAELFGRIKPGDVLFIDGSHMALMNSDATYLLCEIVPSLPGGVLVQIDDVFLPWDYPPTWTERFYGEQYLVASYLLGGAARWSIDFAGWHLTQISDKADRFDPLWPLVETRFGRVANSFWFETTD